MQQTYRSWRLFDEGGTVAGRLERRPLDELRREGGVLIRGAYAGVNYKDALAGLNRAKIVRRFPCTAGIEVTGTVEQSDDPRFAPGDPVIVHGFGLGADRDGGFTEMIAVPADLVVRLPATLDLWEAGVVGVAGYTAALAIDAMEHNGLAPGGGPVAVNGATGGVASLAIDMLAGRGYDVHAITRQPDDGWLRGLGAARVLAPQAVGARPLESARWAGAIDSLGAQALDALLRTMLQDGVVASFGNAMGNDLATSVLPFILRGVRLLGINANSPMPLRERIWARIASDLHPRHAASIGSAISLEDLPKAFETLIEGRGRGRFVVDLSR
jgi:putative YhdH/YhfP family quinone oxidoreductase